MNRLLSYLIYALMIVFLVMGCILWGLSGFIIFFGAIAGGFALGFNFAVWIDNQENNEQDPE